MPLTTRASPCVDAGTMNPPGHMQKLYTPRPIHLLHKRGKPLPADSRPVPGHGIESGL